MYVIGYQKIGLCYVVAADNCDVASATRRSLVAVGKRGNGNYNLTCPRVISKRAQMPFCMSNIQVNTNGTVGAFGGN